MTVIAAASWDGSTYIGCDQAGTDSWGIQRNHGSKLIVTAFGVVGYSGSYRVAQLIRGPLRALPDVPGERGMLAIVKTIETCLVEGGWTKSAEKGLPKCSDLSLLVAMCGGDIWSVNGDLSFLPCNEFSAIGSGREIALGSLFASHGSGASAVAAVNMAVRASCAINRDCGFPLNALAARRV